jgi:hypothetical protein
MLHLQVASEGPEEALPVLSGEKCTDPNLKSRNILVKASAWSMADTPSSELRVQERTFRSDGLAGLGFVDLAAAGIVSSSG